MKEAIRSSETSVITRAARRHILEDDILRKGLFKFQIRVPAERTCARNAISVVPDTLLFYVTVLFLRDEEMGRFGRDFHESCFLSLSLCTDEVKSQSIKIDYLQSRHIRPEENATEKDLRKCLLGCRMSSSGVWYRVGLIMTDVSEEFVASVLMVKRIKELGSALATAIYCWNFYLADSFQAEDWGDKFLRNVSSSETNTVRPYHRHKNLKSTTSDLFYLQIFSDLNAKFSVCLKIRCQ
jgi:hypothetical protein